MAISQGIILNGWRVVKPPEDIGKKSKWIKSIFLLQNTDDNKFGIGAEFKNGYKCVYTLNNDTNTTLNLYYSFIDASDYGQFLRDYIIKTDSKGEKNYETI